MALARYERAIQDGSGNLLSASLQCEVRRANVAGTPKAPLFSDRDGAVPLGNPFSFSDGIAAFHAAGGAYNVRVYGAGYDETFTYQGIGTGSEVDADTLLIPGFLFEFETGTTAPPGDGGIRANNADLSAATRLYVSKLNIAGSDLEASLLALNGSVISLTGAALAQQVVWTISAVTDHTGYIEFTIGGHDGVTSLPVGRVGLQKSGADGAAGTNGTNGALNGIEVIETTASRAVGTSDNGKTLIANRASAIAFNFAAAATLGSTFLVLVKNIGAGDLTLDGNGSETIDGALTVVLKTGQAALVSCNGTALRTFMLPVTMTAGQYRQAVAGAILTAAAVWADAAEAALTDAATIAIDLSSVLASGAVVLGGNRTLGNPSNGKVNQSFTLWCSATGSTRTLSLGSNYRKGSLVETFPISITTSEVVGVHCLMRSSTIAIVTGVTRYTP